MSSSPKRIFICCSSYPPEIGGAPGRVYNVAQLLKAAGYAVTVFTSMPNYPRGRVFPEYRRSFIRTEMLEGIEVRRLWLLPSNAGSIRARGLSLLSQCFGIIAGAARRLVFGKADLIFISSPPLLTSYLYARLARLGRKKVMVNISDIWPLTATELGALRRGPVLSFLQRAERRLYRASAGITGQSAAILEHVSAVMAPRAVPPLFLYRNLPAAPLSPPAAGVIPSRKILYAGALGFAQGMLDVCRNADFRANGLTLDIFGDGVECAAIQAFAAADADRGIRYFSPVSPVQLRGLLAGYDAMLIPLRSPISGAVPSKFFTAISAGLPVLFCSGGEGETLVKAEGLGWCSTPGDYSALNENLRLLARLNAAQLSDLRRHILAAAGNHFNKALQDEALLRFVSGCIGYTGQASNQYIG